MASKKINAISEIMRRLDICMLTTQTARGLLTSRPMSNNGDVEYDGNSYFFIYEDSRAVKDIEENPQVNLCFEGPGGLYISLTGKAKDHSFKEKNGRTLVAGTKRVVQRGN